MKSLACVLFGMLVGTYGFAAQSPDRVSQLLNAVGGQETWSDMRYVHTYAVNHHPQARLPYTQEGWIDLDRPRHLLELCSFDLQRQRVYTEQGGAGVSEGNRYDFDAQRHAEELQFWRSTIYRMIRLLARAGAETQAEVIGDVIHVTEGDTYLGWIAVDPDTGAPLSLGSERDAPATVTFSQLQDFGPVAWVGGGEEPGGWNFEILSFELLGPQSEVAFELSADLAEVCKRY